MAADPDEATRQAFEQLGRTYCTYGGSWSARVHGWLAAGRTVPDAALATLRRSVLISYSDPDRRHGTGERVPPYFAMKAKRTCRLQTT
ncbi:hypothetical protein [Streptomyces sp. NBC_00503]|uniref:hypothetical protein n=1 Tax=Streptomyces sp. NBC_00503 TaxID=2903659 RepID=UPI002E820E8D|nr:hypothetical protein [Streptomyces sp. NBC_00503]WUD83208.1 hypothetical protein OG490_23075 [Streptomyces sp. NBC_00503]